MLSATDRYHFLELIYKKIRILQNLPMERVIYIFLCVVLLFSSYLNFQNNYELLHDVNFFHYPLYSFFNHENIIFDKILLGISLFSCCLLLSSKNAMYSLPFIINGFANLYIVCSDLMSLHHDMLFSGITFILIGLYYLLPSASGKKVLFQLMLAAVATTYFLSGVAKISPDFLSGEAATMIIERSYGFKWGAIYQLFIPFVLTLTFYSMLVELIEPIILCFTKGKVKQISVLVTFPFHLGILFTGTGLIYNTLYPAIFLALIYFNPAEKVSNRMVLTHKVAAIAYCSVVLSLLIKLAL
jgi:hypothetical protein